MNHWIKKASRLLGAAALCSALLAICCGTALAADIPQGNTISRAGFIRLIVNTLGADIPEPEAGVPEETWYAPYVKVGYAMGLFANSTEDMSFTPTDGFFMAQGYADMEQPISRYDAAAILAHAVPANPGSGGFTDQAEIEKQPPLLQEELKTAAKFLPPLKDGGFHGGSSLTPEAASSCAWKLLEGAPPRPAAPAQPPLTAAEALRQNGRIIHAGGTVAGPSGTFRTYTNSAEALVNAYRAGNRVMEFDFLQTSDGHLACIHDWASSFSPSIRDGVPLSLEAWLQAKVYGELTPLCLESLADFMREHPDLYIVTDVKSGNVEAAAILADACPDLLDRFIIQIYKDSEYEAVTGLGFQNIIYTLYNLSGAEKRDTQHLLEFAAAHPLLGFTYPEELRWVAGYTESMKKAGVMLFVHTVNAKDVMDACYSEGFTAIYSDHVQRPY